MKKVILTATFMEVKHTVEKNRKRISSTETDVKVVFEGKNKSHCIQQAKENFRTGVEWKHEFEVVNIKLIACAPEMLEILKVIIEEPRIKESMILSGENSILNDNIRKAISIIKKATE